MGWFDVWKCVCDWHCRCLLCVRICSHRLTSLWRSAGTRLRERTTYSVITTGMETLIGTSHVCPRPPPSLSLSLFLFCLLLSTLVPYWCLVNMYTKHLFTTLSVELCSIIHPKYTCRSPWSNKYDPPLPDGAVPSDRLRRLEVEANQAFDTYREL